jgi:hypothetical protein
MKYKIIIFATLVVSLGACSDEWLNDIEPQGKLLEVNYYETEEEIKNGLVSIYSMYKNQYWQGTWSSWYIAASIPSDDAVPHGGGRGDRPEIWDLYDYNYTPITLGLESIWDRCYFGIYRSNVIITRVDPNARPSNRQMIAEAKMLRALFNFDLVRYFGEAPLIDHILTSEEYAQKKDSKADIFNLIVNDLKDASADLPESWTGEDKYRMTKYAAHGLLGKVYTYMASPFYNLGTTYYDSAATQLNLVIDQGPYSLEDDFDQIWRYENEFNDETLIEMSYSFGTGEFWDGGAESPGNVIQQLTGLRGALWTAGSVGSDTLTVGWGFDLITQDLVDEYRAQGDSVRLHGTALAEWQLIDWGLTSIEKNEAYTGYYTKKRMSWKELNPGGLVWGWGNNERILRLADIYLLYAEVLSQTGSDAEAITYVDIVRTRAGLGSITTVMSSQSLDLYAAIKLERRLELAQEAQRYFDLIRWGDAGSVLGPLGFVAGKHEHYPIPQTEIDDSQGALIQNPAYQ